MCAHDWQPIPNWYARYRCTICHVMGCKFGVVVCRHGAARSVEIQPYRCEARCGGKKCNAPAVHGWAGKKLRCAEHRQGANAARARHQAPGATSAEAPAVAASDETAAPQIEERSTEST
jgi:hypothetical protein